MTGDERFAGRRVTVMGLGSFGGGAAAARWLAGRGARVTVTDLKPAEALRDSLAALADLPIRFVLGEHREEDLLGAELVVKSPAVPPSSPWVRRLEEAGVPMTSELVLALERLAAPCALVTGSKGKSTTSTLLGALLAGEGRRVVVAGNNERPLLDLVDELPADGLAVLEVSSFMADDVARARREGARLPRPRALVLTSLVPEHVTWHGGAEPYYEAKLSLLELDPEVVVIPRDDRELAARVPARARGRLVRVAAAPPADVHLVGEEAVGGGEALFRRDALRLLGAHNLENALLAAATARAVVCLGEMRERVAGAVEAAVAAGAGAAEVVRADGFEQAFAAAVARCPAGGAVLLAPGTASYDMFPHFKARGERFRALALAACAAAPGPAERVA